ncbi:MAG: hypothetical protein VX265_13380 [Myxococcota bacterium]|nr:hypothetical protein [Myxococcota bacterium]
MRRTLVSVLAMLAGCGQTIVWSQEYRVLDEDVWEEEEGDRYDNQFFCQEGQSGTVVDECEREVVDAATGVRKGEVCVRDVAYVSDAGVEYGGHRYTFTRVESTCAEVGYAFLCDEAAKLYGATKACNGLAPPE